MMDGDRQITVRGAPPAIEAWLETLTGPVVPDWSRAPDIEQRVKGRRNGRWPICLVWSGNGGHPRTAVFLQPLSEAEVRIQSLVALDRKGLSPEDRDAALEAFRAAFVAPRGRELELAERTGTAELPDLIGPQAQARFTEFVRTAHKAVPHAGPDLPRWYDFLIQLHRDGASPPREALDAALQEAGFRADARDRLLEAYEHTDALLARYDAFGAGS